MLDCVDDRLTDGHADPMHRLVVESRHPTDVVAHDLDEVEHVECAAEIEANAVPAGHRGSDDDYKSALRKVQSARSVTNQSRASW